jgi:hypothetical protein
MGKKCVDGKMKIKSNEKEIVQRVRDSDDIVFESSLDTTCHIDYQHSMAEKKCLTTFILCAAVEIKLC